MATRRNGVYIIQGEISLVVSALRRNVRWGSHSHQVRIISKEYSWYFLQLFHDLILRNTTMKLNKLLCKMNDL